jgi:protein O-mannosyl-transferase
MPPVRGPLLTGKNLYAVLCVLLAGVTIALYSSVIGHSFVVLDDHYYVTANSHIHDGLSWNTIRWAFTSTEAENWHPLTWLSHAFDYQLFALNPAGHHLDSVLIHALNAVLLFLLLAWVTKRVGPSLLVAALFALHPINVESVAWVAERKNVLSTLFLVLAIGAYVWYAKKPNWRRYLLVAVLFAAGLMAKPMVITLPFVLLLLDYWPLQRTRLKGAQLDRAENGLATSNGVARVDFSRLLLEKVPLLFLSAASAWITLIAQRPAERTFEQFSLAVRIENAIAAYPLYLWKMLWPAQLAVLYPHPGNTIPMWRVILSAFILAGVTGLVVVFRRRSYLPAGWFWFLGTLVPVIGLVQVGEQAMADRYAYVPLIGIFVMFAFGLADLADANVLRSTWCVLLASCALAALGVITLRQISFWESEYTLWSHALAVTDPERNAYAHDSLGAALLDPDSAMTHRDLENFDTEQKRINEARRQYEEALKIDRQLAQQYPNMYLPDLVTTLNNLGAMDQLQNRLDDARQHDEEVLKIYRQFAPQNPEALLPDMAMTLNNLGSLDGVQNRLDDARQNLEGALKIYRQLALRDSNRYLPDLAMTLNDLGNVGRFQNRMDDARLCYEEALKAYRQLAQQNSTKYLAATAGTLSNLGFMDERQNRIEESRVHYTEAMTIYRNLAQGDPTRYAGDVARVEASLRELDRRALSH